MKPEAKEMETYINRNGFPMIRRCKNCIFWKGEAEGEEQKRDYDFNRSEPAGKGLCTFKPMMFAFTLEPKLYPMTKDFFLCENHKFENESKLAQVCEKMLLKDAIKKKSQIQIKKR